MKKVILIAVCTVFLAVLAIVQVDRSMAAEDITNTKHNLTLGTNAFRTADPAANGELCVFCHTPHKGNNNGAPLWNRASAPGPFTMYNAAFSSTIQQPVAAAPQGVSAACLSCHDGATAFDAIVNAPGSGSVAGNINPAVPPVAGRGWAWNAGANNMSTSTYASVGTVLTDDHPISVTYQGTAGTDPAFNDAPITVAGVTLPFYNPGGNQLECATCHNPHEKDNPTFLRVANTNSQLCLGCHKK